MMDVPPFSSVEGLVEMARDKERWQVEANALTWNLEKSKGAHDNTNININTNSTATHTCNARRRKTSTQHRG